MAYSRMLCSYFWSLALTLPLLIVIAVSCSGKEKIEADHHDRDVDQQVADPGRPKRAQPLVNQAPDETTEADTATEPEAPRPVEFRRQIGADHHHVVQHEGEARHQGSDPGRQMAA